MRKLFVPAAALALGLVHQAAPAQPTPAFDRWQRVPADAAPFAAIRSFDLAFGADGLPVLLSLPTSGSTVSARRWTGNSWVNLPGLPFPGQALYSVTATSDWSGDIVVGVLAGLTRIHVFQLRNDQFRRLGQPLPVSLASGFSVAIDARGPVVAWCAGGFITAMRWNGASWAQLGPPVDQCNFFQPQSPALAVTGDGKLVIAYTRLTNDGVVIATRVWSGTKWADLGSGVPSPASTPSLAGENSGAPVVAYLSHMVSQASRWNGTAWEAIGPPCVPPMLGIAFGTPSLTANGNHPLVVCGIHTTPNSSTGRRTLAVRGWLPSFGWQPASRNPVNEDIALAEGYLLAHVIRSDPRGRPWVAWTGRDGLFVSTLIPGSPQ